VSDLVVTAANVKYVSGPLRFGLASAAIAAGQAVWKDLSVSAETLNAVRLADANTGTDANDMVNGVAMNSAAGAGQTVGFLTDDGSGTSVFEITGATLVVGAAYILSGTAGGIAPIADLATGWMLGYLCHAITTTQLKLGITNTGTRKP
jgi:hypothetical protein